MSRLLCCLCVRDDMGAALSHPQEGSSCEGADAVVSPPTMADVIRERKKKAGGASLGTLRRRLAAAARRPRDARPDRGCEHARYIRSVVSGWRLGEVFLLCAELEAGAALRDLHTQAELAREPAPSLQADLARARAQRAHCDVELAGPGFAVSAHRALLAARCGYFRDLLQRYPSAARVSLEGAAAALSRDELLACLDALYAGHAAHQPVCDKWARGGSDANLDIINVDNPAERRAGVGSMSACQCGRGRVDADTVRRLAGVLGFCVDSLQRDMRYLLDSGEYADARLVFRLEGGCGAQYGFRSALELPCHRVVLAARSRFFRSVMSRRGGGVPGGGGAGGGGAVCVDEKVLPRRFARALLHAAYTDQVDLGLIGRAPSSPSSSAGSTSNTSGWGYTSRSSGAGRASSTALLDDAFQLYEIARFVEMPIVVQGCEDAIVEALCADTLPHILRWSAAPHASPWVHRQAMRYLRDEFPAIMSSPSSARLPRAALHDALGSNFLQASEQQALRAAARWGERCAGTEGGGGAAGGGGGGGREARRREGSEAAVRALLAPLLPLVRTEHLPHDHPLYLQLVRRGMLPAPPAPAPPAPADEASSADAWLGRGAYRSARCFLTYLDEIKALLEDQAVPEAEIALARRARYLQRIPDTLYMVAAARGGSVAGGGAAEGAGAAESACVSPRVLAALRERVRELRHAPPAARALQLHAADTRPVWRQIALRAVRERSLPDSCAELVLREERDDSSERERAHGWESPRARPDAHDTWSEHADDNPDCCRAAGGGVVGVGSLRCSSAGSLRLPSAPAEAPRGGGGTCRREGGPARAHDPHHRVLPCEWSARAPARLSAAVPDVAMAPNANTHLLTARDYFTASRLQPPAPAPATPAHPAPPPVCLQLDLGDGAIHTPRPGSRYARAAAQQAERARPRDAHAPSTHQVVRGEAVRGEGVRARVDEDELRAAIELSVIRAYSSFHPGGGAVVGGGGRAAGGGARPQTATLPHCYRSDLAHLAAAAGVVRRGTPSPSGLSASNSGHLSATRATPDLHAPGRRVGSAEGVVGVRGGGGSRSPSPSPAPSPRRLRRDYTLYRAHDYRLEGNYPGGGGAGSRGHSPSNYA